MPIPDKRSYLKQLISRYEDFIQRLRWKAFFFLKKDSPNDHRKFDTFGFRTAKNAPQIPELIQFESDMTDMIANLEFREVKNKFQETLRSDIKKIKSSKSVFVQADKTHNIYQLDKSEYGKLMHDNVTSDYKKTDNEFVRKIDSEAKTITDKLKISDRVERIALKEAYLTVKDHKPEFPNQIKARLINPTKSNIGIISKQILEKINLELKTKLELRLLKNTDETIEWFKATENKPRRMFIQLDIVNYYPSVTGELFDKAIKFAAENIDHEITQTDIDIIKNARKSILEFDGCRWTKKNEDFDITMGAYDGAQITDLVGLYILNKLKTEIPEIDFGLYRDDGLGIHKRIPTTKLEAIKKKLFKMFKDIGLSITLETSLNRVDFLDVTFDLSNQTFEPFRKPNDSPLYINRNSNHPPQIIKNLPSAINRRLSNISATEDLFNKHKSDYENALKSSGHPPELRYEENRETTREASTKKCRQRNVIWFNPPYNMSLQTKIGKSFLALVDKNFPKNHPLHPIANRKTIKISFSCTKNMGSILAAHNAKILKKDAIEKTKECNCYRNKACPVNGKCCLEEVVYKATVEDTKAYYVGMTSWPWKNRYNQHRHSFRTETRKTSTALSQYVHDKKLGPDPRIKWEILEKCSKRKPGERMCNLCVSEKMQILLCSRDPKNINRRNDLSTRCNHLRATKLGSIT